EGGHFLRRKRHQTLPLTVSQRERGQERRCRDCPSVVAPVASSSQLSGYFASSIAIASGVMFKGFSVSNITASSSVREAAMLAMIVPGCGPCGMPEGWCEIDPALIPLREPKLPRT